MNEIKRKLEIIRNRRAELPWRELEAEAARQGCSAADIFFDRAGRGVPGPSAVGEDETSGSPDTGTARLRRNGG